jgi:hypothetical protein
MMEPATNLDDVAQTLEPAVDPAIVAQARQIAYEQGGGIALLIMIGLVVVWRLASSLIGKLQQQQETLLSRLLETLGELKVAVSELKTSSTAATAHLTRLDARLDRAEGRLDDHGGRIIRLETAGESGIRRRRAAGE